MENETPDGCQGEIPQVQPLNTISYASSIKYYRHSVSTWEIEVKSPKIGNYATTSIRYLETTARKQAISVSDV